MAPHDPGGGAGRIQQDGVEGPAVPPDSGLGGVRGHDASLQAEALQVVRDALAAGRIDVQRQQVGIGQLQDMGGLAAGGRAGVQDAQALPWRRVLQQ